MIERDGIQIGIIGAIGDCYSSISSDMVSGITFKVGNQLSALVKAESQKLRDAGADLIVYSIHDGEENYDPSLSNGYVDIVFEAHTHSRYVKQDSYGVYHIQAGGENSAISHAEISINYANGKKEVNKSRIIYNDIYSNYEDHPATEELEDKYSDLIEYAYADLGRVSKYYDDSDIEDFVAQLYLEAGVDKWGTSYDIVLGGGFLKTRTPYNLTSGIKKYADLLSLFPFNNKLCLCSVRGRDLKNKFIYTTNDDYHIAIGSYGNSITIDDNETYYIIVDTYTALYGPNRLTVIDYYDDTTYARDLLADAIAAGRLQ
jgi:2',3'-cyclic-nucleotide 2'-phosphodiesterase (5'-nucleotidase family)